MVKSDFFLTVSTSNIGVDRAALDRTWANEGNLDDEVVELAWLEPRQGGHLGTGLHLEHAHSVGAGEHGVHLGVIEP